MDHGGASDRFSGSFWKVNLCYILPSLDVPPSELFSLLYPAYHDTLCKEGLFKLQNV